MRVVNLLLLALISLLVNAQAWGHSRHFVGGYGHWRGGHYHSHWGGHRGFYVYPSYNLGFGFGAPYYYPRYPYYPLTTLTLPTAPLVYIERDPRQLVPQDSISYWYYCGSPQGYYPDIKTCSTGWIKVPPRSN